MSKEESNPDMPEEPEDDVSRKAESSQEEDENLCPTCGAEIPDDAPEGICPKCALADAASPTDLDLTGPSVAGPRFEPPTVETIAAAFPQLEIVELIGCGGMGAVYKARQPHLDRFVALKVLPPCLAESEAFTDRFSREGRLLAKLSHPNIVGVHDFGQAGGFFYLMMEYVDGVNLRQAMRAGRFTPEQALEIVPEVCQALQFAHDEGVLHRDVKPENILLDSKGQVKIADFGIAKLFGEAATSDPTLTGTAMPGTPQYMAPEQIEQPAHVDHRADIYSLGVVFYEMLTGELPIGRFPAPSEKSAVDSQVDEIVFRSLEKERSLRQQSANEVRTEIEGVPVRALATERHPGYGIPTGSKFNQPSGGKRAAAIVLFGFLIPIILNLSLIFGLRVSAGSAAAEQARAEAERAMAAVEVDRLTAEINQLESQLSEVQDPSLRDGKERELDLKKRDLHDRSESLRVIVEKVPSAMMTGAPYGSLSLLILVIVAFAIPGTMMGWQSLRRIRAFNLGEGRASPMLAALFWPILLTGILMFALIALPLSYGPQWVGALGISLSIVAAIIAGYFAVRTVLRWMNTPATESEREAILAEANRQDNPWKRRLFWLVVGLMCLPALLIFLYLTAGQGTPFVPGYFELVIIGAVIGFFVWLFRRLARSRHPERYPAPARARTEPPLNPWPRRIFWLLIIIFVVPISMIFLFLMLPWLAYDGDHPKSHSVRLRGIIENESSVSIEVETRRFTSLNVGFHIRYEGPEFPINQDEGHDKLWPGQGQEWNLYGDSNRRADKITFVLPDRHTAELAARAIGLAFKEQQGHRDTKRVDLFDVKTPTAGPFRAWIEIRSDKTGTGYGLIEFEARRIMRSGSQLEIGFARSGDRSLFLEVTQDVVPGPDGKLPEEYLGPEDTMRVQATGPQRLTWTLPAEFDEDAILEAVRQIDNGWIAQKKELREGAQPEFVNLKHPDGWRYVLSARVLRPGVAAEAEE